MKQNRLILAITYSAIALFTLISLSTEAQNTPKTIKRIIIDPGHGGTDPGSNGKYSTEAAVSLAISLKLEEYINESIPDVEVVLTRRTDIYNSVVEKANIANAAKGDLFICIHTNSADPRREREIIGYTNKTYTVKKKGVKRKVTRRVPLYKTTYTPSTARGTETFIYNVGKSEQKKDMANEAVDDVVEKLDSISIKQIKEIEEADPTRSMMVSLLTQQFFQRAASLALTIEEEFKAAGRISREAKQRQKGIWVLAAVQMPAVLVETGFISNPEDEDYLNSEEGQNQICEVITKSVIRYKNSLENQKKTNAN
ncbi:MAG: N-acetylmuramoyl-L-alanine amidase [Chitinophagia bacterium]|jgi:N-acetylmuramoyl-L-alanine amidase|nr:N-acetylmuramoyl-L-alanine amidase [Chitinophagia bacterium]NCA30055.1 N-acetylmuramoyl-L-alanine amidase [Chitinophagia bacterium]NDD15675.1 N-acetylmuramoyl-L-alanine amidase [Chitinophagia bacterium]